jgi:ERCC4-type nuclease
MLMIDPQGSKDGKGSSMELVHLLPPELVSTRRLEAGDVAFLGHGPEGPYTIPVGIEYKKVGDAITSMINKRFVAEQFQKMTEQYQRIYYLLEGEYAEGPDGTLVVPSWRSGKKEWRSHGWTLKYRQFDNWQNSLAESGKIRFKRSLTPAESAAQVLDIYYMWTKNYDEHKTLFSFDRSQLPPLLTRPSIKRLVAAQIPGVGWELSARAAEHFPTVVDLVTATEDQWTEIGGIGKKKAHTIWSCLRATTLPS